MSSAWNMPPAWAEMPPGVLIGPEEVHVFAVETAATGVSAADWYGILSADEQSAIDAIQARTAKRDTLVCRGALRCILSGLAVCSPSQLRFARTKLGKPFCIGPAAAQQFEFNVTHSEGLALIAIARSSALGIDVEYTRADIDMDSVSRACFTAHENQQLDKSSSDVRRGTFYQIWTRKEALLKLLGLGLSVDPQHFDVSIASRPRELLLTGRTGELEKLTVADLPAAECFRAALACSVAIRRILTWSLTTQRVCALSAARGA